MGVGRYIAKKRGRVWAGKNSLSDPRAEGSLGVNSVNSVVKKHFRL